MQPTLAETIILVIEANKDNYDKIGKLKVLHSLEVMHALRFENIDTQIVGALHDIIEDTVVSEDVLLFKGYKPHIVDAVHALTRKEYEPYFEYIKRVKSNSLATRVKVVDAEHNLRRCRDRIEEFDSLAKKYEKVLVELSTELEIKG